MRSRIRELRLLNRLLQRVNVPAPARLVRALNSLVRNGNYLQLATTSTSSFDLPDSTCPASVPQISDRVARSLFSETLSNVPSITNQPDSYLDPFPEVLEHVVHIESEPNHLASRPIQYIGQPLNKTTQQNRETRHTTRAVANRKLDFSTEAALVSSSRTASSSSRSSRSRPFIGTHAPDSLASTSSSKETNQPNFSMHSHSLHTLTLSDSFSPNCSHTTTKNHVPRQPQEKSFGLGARKLYVALTACSNPTSLLNPQLVKASASPSSPLPTG
ncbi:unnamed protein product [Protopolystoma xenopodis]|uniref:Uncharacterized protein n=1 Tax=Protopolystoma xenopodis TaxID=117903 RepID=A0A3S5B0I2_9PLAT|nr:unnamed protein product [Protopolystoma xenopodis]